MIPYDLTSLKIFNALFLNKCNFFNYIGKNIFEVIGWENILKF